MQAEYGVISDAKFSSISGGRKREKAMCMNVPARMYAFFGASWRSLVLKKIEQIIAVDFNIDEFLTFSVLLSRKI